MTAPRPPHHPPPDDTPWALARDTLQQSLDERLALTHRPGPPAPAPRVATLGTTDARTPPKDEPHRSLRRRANVHLTADTILIGPWDDRGTEPTACGNCLALRRQRLRSRSEREALENGSETRATARRPPLPAYVLDAVWALYQARLLPRHPDHTRHGPPRPRVTELDLTTLHTRTVPILPDPICPACTEPRPQHADEARITLTSRTKPHPETYRLRPAASLPLPEQALANPVCGALGPRTHLNLTSPTTAPVSGAAFVRGYAGLTDVNWSGQSNSYTTSRRLALLEGLERYAGTHQRRGTRPVLDSYDHLHDAALDPRTCGSYTPDTYRDDPHVRPFDPAATIPWIWGYSLRDQRPLLVPVRLAHYSAELSSDNFVFESSNGCATGSCLEEAILHGLLELIERDAFLLHWYGAAEATEIDLRSLTTGPVRAMADRAALQGYRLHAFDSRADLPIPVVTGLAVRHDGGPGHLSFAAGAALDPEQAITAALAEVLTYIPHLARQVHDHHDELQAMADDFTLVRHLPDHARLFGLPRMARHADTYLAPAARRTVHDTYRDWARIRPRTDDLLDDLGFCLDHLTGAGHDVIVVDQTTPEQQDIGLRTVATIVPGLLPIDFGWHRQRALTMPRLRTAFRRAGRRTTDLSDEEIRRVPHPFP